MEIRPFLPDPAGLACTRIEIDQGRVTLELAATSTAAVCPTCGQPSRRVNSRYVRTLGDLPWMGLPVRLRLWVRRFFCDNPACPRTFAERLSAVADDHARKTVRLSQTLRQIGLALGGSAGARLASRLAMPASGDTLLRLVRRTPVEPVATVAVLGVDDWAWRKGQRYGTVLCDLEQHQVVDLLEDRSAEHLADWLTGHPGTEVISRDRGGIYAEGARTGAPQAVQVADRFHLLCNLREALIRLLDRHHRQVEQVARAAAAVQPSSPAAVIQQPSAADPPSDSATCQPPGAGAPPAAETSRSRRLQRYTQMVELHAQGLGMRQIARQMGLHRSTVRRFLNAGGFPERASRQYVRQLDRFADYLRQRWEQGCHNAAALARELAQQGFKGSGYAVRRYVAAWREPSNPSAAQGEPSRRHSVIERPSSNRVAWLLLGYPVDRPPEEQAFAEALRQQCPEIGLAAELAQQFAAMVHERKGELLDDWLAKAGEPAAPSELRNFASGLKRDYKAVKAALTLQWSNGQVEGQINRLKFLKRQMYGRANFDLLRQRVLNTG
jgi:transposase